VDIFINNVAAALQSEGYLVEANPEVPGVQGLLLARSRRRFRMAFANVEDFFLFVDWGNAAYGRLEHLKDMYQHFSGYANKFFRIPHSLRMHIPNLALVAVAEADFPPEVIQYARRTYLNPWYGGETGQIMLIDAIKQQVICHDPPERRQTGAYPLDHAAEVIQEVCRRAFHGEVS